MAKKVLIVDDSATVRMYHKDILSRAGYECDEAANGMEALEKTAMNGYDLYIVDINMPVLDGYSFAKRLRNEKHKLALVIMISTESEYKDMDLAYQSGASYYLIKPTKPDSLLAVAKLIA